MKCARCSHDSTYPQRTDRVCPKCKKKKLVRQIGSGGGIIFKGSGFYQTDYKKASPPPSEASPGCGKDACKATPGTCAADASKSSK